MDNSIQNILTGFVDERLDSTMELLRDTDKEYLSLTKRLTSILEKMDNLKSVDAEDMAVINVYREVMFNIQAKEEPAIYIQGFSDALHFLKFFHVL